MVYCTELWVWESHGPAALWDQKILPMWWASLRPYILASGLHSGPLDAPLSGRIFLSQGPSARANSRTGFGIGGNGIGIRFDGIAPVTGCNFTICYLRFFRRKRREEMKAEKRKAKAKALMDANAAHEEEEKEVS